MALAAVVGITAGYHLLRETSYRFWIPLATLTMRRIACDAFERVQRFSADWHANSIAGSTVRKISRGMWAYDLFADTFYVGFLPAAVILAGVAAQIGRASCRERVCPYGLLSGGAVLLKKKNKCTNITS